MINSISTLLASEHIADLRHEADRWRRTQAIQPSNDESATPVYALRLAHPDEADLVSQLAELHLRAEQLVGPAQPRGNGGRVCISVSPEPGVGGLQWPGPPTLCGSPTVSALKPAGYVVKSEMARSITGATRAHIRGGAAPTITEVAFLPSTRQASSTNRSLAAVV